MLRVTRGITIKESELDERFIRASGPGGQHADRAATAVQLRFDVANSSLPDEVQERLLRLAENQITEEGVLIIEAKRFRSQRKNRRDARWRLVELVREAAKEPRVRKKTEPTRASEERRLQEKKHRSRIKRLRKPPPPEQW